MTAITIPSSREERRRSLAAKGPLATAIAWERAALVATDVRLADREGRPSKETASSRSFLSPSEFAALGIHGFRTADTVRLYVQRWLDANDGRHPEPGEDIELPDAEWPPTRTGTDGYDSADGVARTVDRIAKREGGADELAKAVASDPELAKRVVEHSVLADPSVALAAEKAARERWERDQAKRAAEPFRRELVPPVAFTQPTAGELAALGARRWIYQGLKCLREAADQVKGHRHEMSDDDVEYIQHLLTQVPPTVDLVNMSLEALDVDWDAVVASWGEDPGSE